MDTEPLDFLPLWALLLAAIALLGLGLECGYRFGNWRRATAPEEKDQSVGTTVAAILGLLALVLGFTFNLAASRFDNRRRVVLEEANAVGTTYLRTRLLPEPQRTETARLLREYVQVRLDGTQPGQLSEAITRSEELHQKLWTQATKAAEGNPGSIMSGLFVQSLNELIDLHAKRMMVGVRSRIPIVLWGGLYALAMIGMAALGYQSGLSATRRSPAMFALVVAFSIVLFMIADLDRGHQGLMQVSQQAMRDVQSSMQFESP